MRLMITGEKGYIGSVLIPVLLKKNYEVVGLNSLYFNEKLDSNLRFINKI
jgi:nucleoside-diphosphate-sugar epimerase